MEWKEHIMTDPGIMLGKPVIKGTRIAVDLILEKLSNGDTIEDLLLAYPHITKENILAALSYASDSIKNVELLEN